jgi:hypothetical protein
MPRTLVLLLILPMLLMPPGMCICPFVPIGNATAASIPAPPDRERSVGRAPSPQQDRACDSCCRARTSAVPQRGDDQPTLPQSERPSTPGKHLPGCPAAVGDLPLNVAVPPVKVQADFAAPDNFSTPVCETAAPSDCTRPVPTPTGSPPLFISHCTLLI